MLELYAHMRVELGMSREEFLDLEPVVFFALADQISVRIRRENFRAGLMPTLLSSLFSKDGARVKQPLEWFDPPKKPPLEEQLEAFFMPFPAKPMPSQRE